jgi:nicotinate-nucleotide pyrophosphorylase (carboxylating)
MPSEDISTNSVIKEYTLGKADLICKQDGVIAGLEVFKRVFEMLDKRIEFEFFYKDGDDVKNKDLIAEVIGDIRGILSAERTALNYLQRMSGIASYTKKVVNLLKDTNIKLLDTRKKRLITVFLKNPRQSRRRINDRYVYRRRYAKR